MAVCAYDRHTHWRYQRGILYFWQPWAKALSEEKGKLDAREIKLDAILAEAKAVTAVTKQIESQLAGDLWEKQTLRAEKRQVYGDVLKTVHDAARACQHLIDWRNYMGSGQQWQQPGTNFDVIQAKIAECFNQFEAAQSELIRLLSLLQIFAKQSTSYTLHEYLKTDRRMAPNIGTDEIREQRERLVRVGSEIVENAKLDLGINVS